MGSYVTPLESTRFAASGRHQKQEADAAAAHFSNARAALSELREKLNPIRNDRGQVALGTAQLAAYAEALALIWPCAPLLASELLDVLALDLPVFEKQTASSFPKMWKIFADWSEKIDRLRSHPEEAPDLSANLAARAAQVGD